MIRDEGLGPLVKEKWPGKNCEPADPLARLSFHIAEMVTVPLLWKVTVTDRVKKLKKYLMQMCKQIHQAEFFKCHES